jgi:hypothetical protein
MLILAEELERAIRAMIFNNTVSFYLRKKLFKIVPLIHKY